MEYFIKLKHTIDPRIDYVFKVIFASLGNEHVIVDFLNAVIKPETLIKTVKIGNPFNERESEHDKLSVVDIKVIDEKDFTYQIEMQLGSHRDIKPRSLVNWAQIYSKQKSKGEDYSQFRPAISIWLLNSNITTKPNFHNVVEMRYRDDYDLYIDHMEIHLLELKKWQMPDEPSFEDLWLYILSQPHSYFDLPLLFEKESLRRVMNQIREISEQEHKWFRYHSQMMYQLDQAAKQRHAEEDREARLKAEEKIKETEEKVKKAEAKLKQAEQQNALLLAEIAQLKNQG